ncbi:MAG: glycosyltransferase family 2 protein, partial [Acidobacteria bacterium]|nr:glycosyltransferase family 2 protein [Acidobacteriota bacterium]
ANADWLTELAQIAMAKNIGAVGPKVLNRQDAVVGTGLIVGTKEIVSIAHDGFHRYAGGNIGRNVLTSNFSAVSILCLATRREIFESVTGFDAENFPGQFFDADLCLRLRERDLRIVLDPHSMLETRSGEEADSPSQSTKAEAERFRRRWSTYFEGDPFYNPNFSRRDGRFRLKT